MTLRTASFLPVIFLLQSAALPAALPAGTVLTMRTMSPAGTHTSKIYIQGGNLRVDSGEMRNSVISRAATATMYVVNAQDRSYIEMTPQSLEKSRQAILRRLDERDDLSQEEKNAIREQLEAAREGGGAPSWSYHKVAGGVRVGGFLTDEYDVNAGSLRVEQVWVAEPAQLKIAPADLAALRELQKKFAGPGAPSGIGFLPGAGAPDGVPVRLVRYDRGRRISSATIVSASSERIPEALFRVPASYEKKPMELPEVERH